MPGPLAIIRVIDMTSMISGPLATMMLGDQGADIIKVEAPGGVSASFLHNNRSKRSAVLDLKTEPRRAPQARRDRRRLVQNSRPSVAARTRAGDDAIRAVAPTIVYVSISGFGEDGPYRDTPFMIRWCRACRA